MEQMVFYKITPEELNEIVTNAVEMTISRIEQAAKEKADKQAEESNSDLITREEVCKLFRITLPTLHNWTKSGRLPSYKFNSRVRYKKTEIMEIINQNGRMKYKNATK